MMLGIRFCLTVEIAQGGIITMTVSGQKVFIILFYTVMLRALLFWKNIILEYSNGFVSFFVFSPLLSLRFRSVFSPISPSLRANPR